MRYKLDADGYVKTISFGCDLDDCKEYTGEIPIGYNSLADWADYACIKAYYIDSNGNLLLDLERLTDCRKKEAEEAINYAPLIRRDLYETDEILDSQWLKGNATGEVITLEDIKTITPVVKITGIKTTEYTNFSIFTHGRNMMPCDAVSKEVSGVSFVKNDSGSLTIKGTATEDVLYTVSGGSEAVIFALKKGHEYYLNLGDLECELRLLQGDTAMQQYVGASGLLNLSQSIEVSEVLVKIPQGTTVDVTFFSQLEYGNAFTAHETHKRKALDIDFSEACPETLYPSDTLYASDTLYVGKTTAVLDYIVIRDGLVYASVSGREQILGEGNAGLFGDYNTIYVTKDATLEVEYRTNVYDVSSLEFLQGKSTTTNQFRILKDGSIEAHNGYFSGKIEADSGKIGGFDIGEKALFNGKTAFSSGNGVYVGIDGISVGNGEAGFRVTSGGAISIGYNDNINIGGAINFTSSLWSKIKHNGSDIIVFSSDAIEVKKSISIDYGKSLIVENSYGNTGTEITYNKIQTGSNYIDYYGISCDASSSIKCGSTIRYTNINYDTLKLVNSGKAGIELTAGYAKITSNSYPYAIKNNSDTELASIENTTISIHPAILTLGKSGGNLGFYGSSGTAKKTVSNITTTSSATASTVATKLNDLLTVLRNYNLIG